MAKHSRGESSSRVTSRAKYYLALCATVFVGWLCMDAFIFAMGYEPMLHSDAQSLYTNFFAWEGQALRGAFASLFSGNGFEFPLYTYTLGYGADTIVTMMDCLNDPFNLIAVFFPPDFVEVPFIALIPVRMMLSAVTFSWYCFERGHGKKEVFVAALCFAFAGFSVYWGAVRHANFINWSILLPVILLGADRIFKGEKPTMFIWGMALMFLSAVYFAYMSCLALLVYCLVKYFLAPRDRSAGDFFKLVGKFVLFLVIAFSMSAVFSIPSVIALMSQSRATDGVAFELIHELATYASLSVDTVGGVLGVRALYEGAVPVVLMCVFVCCGRHFQKEVRRPWIVGLALCLVGVLVPFVWHAFNGFGYPTDRWMLVINFVCAYVVCLTIPVVAKLEKRDLKRMTIAVVVVALWAGLYVVYPLVVSSDLALSIWPLTMLVVLAIVFVFTYRKARHYAVLLSVAVIVGVSLNTTFDMTPLGSKYLDLLPSIGTVNAHLSTASPAAAMDGVDDDSIHRQSYPRVYNNCKNATLLNGDMGVDFYSSFYNQRVDDYRQELGMSDHYRNYSFVGNDSRIALEAFAGVKYFIAKESDEWRVPYGFEKMKGVTADGSDYLVYQSKQTIPVGFLSDKVVSRSDYDKLSMVEKQNALISGIVVKPDDLTGSYEAVAPEPLAERVEYKVGKTDGLSIEGNIIVTTKADATMVLEIEGKPKSETYVAIDEMLFSAHSPARTAELAGNEVSALVRLKDLLWNPVTTYAVDFAAGKHHRSVTMATPEAVGYGGREDWVVNMGYSDKGKTEIQLKFAQSGTYTFDDLAVYCQPVDPILPKIDEMGKTPFDELKLGTNRVEATATLKDDASKLAFFSLAYTPGWTATVDGKEAPIVNADTAFMAVELSGQGSHEVVFTYVTPGLREGAILTVVGIIAFVVVVVVSRRTRRHAR